MKLVKALIGVTALAVAGAVAFTAFRPAEVPITTVSNTKQTPSKQVRFSLVPSSDAVKKCLPHAKVDVKLDLRTDETGRDIFTVDASGLKPNTSFTTFLLEVPGSPFGAAEYFGDVDTDKYGKAHVEFRLIVEEAFASTLVNGKRVRVDLSHV